MTARLLTCSAFPFYLENDMSSDDSRYPYTYACDFIRSIAGYGEGGTKLSRSDASQIRSQIAQIIGMPDEDLARKIADHYLADQDTIERKQAEEFLSSIGISPFGVA